MRSVYPHGFCCVTDHPNTWCLRTTIISLFAAVLWVGIWGWAWQGQLTLFCVMLVGLTHMSRVSASLAGEDGEAGKAGVTRAPEASLCLSSSSRRAQSCSRGGSEFPDRSKKGPNCWAFPMPLFSSLFYVLRPHWLNSWGQVQIQVVEKYPLPLDVRSCK